MSNDDTRARKVQAALEGQDEFSVFSIEPDMRKAKVELEAPSKGVSGRPETAPQSGMFMRLFKKMFRG